MYEVEESYQGPRLTAQDDPRVTLLGRWLRQTKLNEAPQFWNVLKGEMSLVGPRPEDPQLAAAWPEEARREVLSLRPGITSPASVLYRDEERQLNDRPLMETYLEALAPSKLRLDQLYVRNHSFWLDLDILFWTALALLPRLGTQKPPEDALFAGFFSRLLGRMLSWYAVDALITLASLVVAGLAWRSTGPFDVGWLKSIGLALLFALLFSLCGALLGTHRVSWSKATGRDLLNLLAAVGLATVLTLLANRFLGGLRPGGGVLFPPAMLLTAAGLSFVGFALVRFRGQLFAESSRGWLARQRGTRAVQEKVLIIGSGEAGRFAAWLLSNGSSAALFNVVGFVDDDLYKQGRRISGVSVLGGGDQIPQLVERHDIGVLVFAIHNITADERRRLLEICAQTPARLVLLPDILGMFNQAVDGGASSERSAEGKMELEQVLAELEALAQQGDLQAIQERLAELRERQ